MRRFSNQTGMTMVEMMVAVVITLLVFAAAMSVLDLFMHDNRNDENRNETQDNARTAIDNLSSALRNVASPSVGSAGALEQAGSYNLVFQTVNASTTYGGSNATNQERVRYCLDTSTNTLWLQTQTWTTASAPSIPSTTTCPGPTGSGEWNSTPPAYELVSNVTNEVNGQNRPVFNYGPCGTSCTSTSQIKSVEVDLFLNLNTAQSQPGETEITSGIYLRNSLAPPVASFIAYAENSHEILDASASSDPNGQALSYQWSENGTAIAGATTQTYDAGAFTCGCSETFGLTVTDTGGLSSSTSETVTVP